MQRGPRLSFVRLVLIMMLFMPGIVVGTMWIASYGCLVFNVYDSDRQELWALYKGELLVNEGLVRTLAPPHRFEQTLGYLDYPDHPDRRISLWYVTVPAVFLASIPLLTIIRRWIVRILRRRNGLCGECAYDLRGSFSGVCPECGSPSKIASMRNSDVNQKKRIPIGGYPPYQPPPPAPTPTPQPTGGE